MPTKRLFYSLLALSTMFLSTIFSLVGGVSAQSSGYYPNAVTDRLIHPETPMLPQRSLLPCYAPGSLPPFPSFFPQENQIIGDIPRRTNRLFARVFLAAFMRCDVIRSRRRGREIVSPPGLRFSPLEVFA